ncbi:hypothetical protein MMC27_007620 [Xylographa pallens]|nr:hypothetical protein [Xylographa pallens]
MRLVHTKTLELVDTETLESIPAYGILSHRWEEEEVTFQEMQSDEVRRNKKGFQKIKMCCRIANCDKLEYVWVDTCCIDKRSSSELQEAINSMYQWYEEAERCYAYLFDVETDWKDDQVSSSRAFGESVWFQRGWTLQELVAPHQISFYSHHWRKLGDKHLLQHEISAATGISVDILAGYRRLQDFSVAERMSWASRRITKRIEDRAYSLLGIFDVRMPMLYGEGKKAFLRLQEEIIKQSDDQSLFAWQGTNIMRPGMLALEPEAFETCHGISNKISMSDRRARKRRHPYSVNNRGLSITLYLKPWTIDTYIAVIECSRTPASAEQTGHRGFMGIFLRRLVEDDQYARVSVHGVEIVDILLSEGGLTEYRSVLVNVCQAPLLINNYFSVDDLRKRVHGIRISTELLKHDSHGRSLFEIKGNLRKGLEEPKYPHGFVVYGHVGTLDISKQKGSIKFIKLGFDFEFNPVCVLSRISEQDGVRFVNDRSRMLDWVGDWELTTAENHSEESIYDRSLGEWLGWSTITAKGVAYCEDERWVFKGDRLEGFSVVLVSSYTPYRANIKVSMRKEIKGLHLGWVFALHEPN